MSPRNSVGACLKDALCALDEFFFGNQCDCPPPPPPQVANCAATTAACVPYDPENPACRGPGGSHPIASYYADGQTQAHYWPYYDDYRTWTNVTTTPDGTLVTQTPGPDQCGGARGCSCPAAQYCFCPKPMIPTWTPSYVKGRDEKYYIFSCLCPEGTHAGATMPDGISNCLCDNTNKPAIMSGLAPFGMCPPPDCPAGQTRLGGVGECVTPCADPSQGMAFDGSCCNPAQISICGTCCPPDTVPDPKSGSCVPRPKPPK